MPEQEVRVVELKAAEREISPRDLCAKFQPFKELVADEIEQDGEIEVATRSSACAA